MIVENIMSTKFSVLKISDSEGTACQLMVETGSPCLPVIGDADEPLGVTANLLQDPEELKFDHLDEDAGIGALDEDDLGDIFVEKPETEDWNQMDV